MGEDDEPRDRAAGATPPRARQVTDEPTFTRAALAACDGSVPGRKVLVAYDGVVYDVTGSYPWHGGRHWGCARAGRDQSGLMANAPHGREMLARVKRVGRLVDG
jgi:predicted heme/steroid binding protein